MSRTVPVSRPAALPVVTAYEGEPREEIGRATTLSGALRIARAFLRRCDFAPDADSRDTVTEWAFTWGGNDLILSIDADKRIGARFA